MYSDAEVAREEAIGLKGEYESRLEFAKEESEEILKNAHRRATLKEEEILREAKDEAARIIERAEAECELERKRIINEVKDDVSDMAIGIASAVIEREVSDKEHRQLIDSFIDGIGDGND